MHAERPGSGIRIPEVFQQSGVATVGGIHGDGKAAIQIRPGLKQPFGMAAANPVVLQGQRVKIGHTAFEDAHRLALNFVAQLVRLFIPPLQAGFLPDDADFLSVH